jgi:hypothetical protein
VGKASSKWFVSGGCGVGCSGPGSQAKNAESLEQADPILQHEGQGEKEVRIEKEDWRQKERREKECHEKGSYEKNESQENFKEVGFEEKNRSEKALISP